MRDIISIPLNNEESLIIASDNSGGIGMKKEDYVHVSYETAAYFSFRVAAMECISAGGEPVSVVLHNFCGDDSWSELVNGVQKGLEELSLENVPITGSTESNFDLHQSAIGLVVLGKRHISKRFDKNFSNELSFAIIGRPLVGDEVIKHTGQVVPLSIFQKIAQLEEIMVWPVGSKGILYELNQMFTNKEFTKEMLLTNLDVLKSSGPATCFIIAFNQNQEQPIKKIAAAFYHSIIVK
ncbi:ATP-binding protein [Neobacillus niacini]|uniref:ATP-binding protein n=1 Tax=Neobacillus niacini TaxID=86668 RepID=UPI0039834768